MNNLIIRRATRQDVPEIVRLLAEDTLSGGRERYETPLPSCYYDAFDEIKEDSRNELIVVTHNNEIIGTLQLTLLPYLTCQGSKRALVEAVFVDERYRGQGVGKQLFQWVFDKARAAGCHMVQLTTNTQRPAAHRFYESLGFVGTHTGMKLYLHDS